MGTHRILIPQGRVTKKRYCRNIDRDISITTNTTTLAPTTNELLLTFDDISNASLMIGGDVTSISNWTTFFDITTGITFTSVEVRGNTVNLKGGANIHLNDSLFDNDYASSSILRIIDTLGCITTAGVESFYNCGLTEISLPELTTADSGCFNMCSYLIDVNLPKLSIAVGGCFAYNTHIEILDLPSLITAGEECFYMCSSLISVSIPKLEAAGLSCFDNCRSLTSAMFPKLTTLDDYGFANCYILNTVNLPLIMNLGTTVFNDNVFDGITGNTIAVTINPDIMTCNSGNPDDDIIYLGMYNDIIINGNPYTPFTGYTGNLSLTFDDVVNVPVADASSVSDWNTFFNLMSLSTPFTSVTVPVLVPLIIIFTPGIGSPVVTSVIFPFTVCC